MKCLLVGPPGTGKTTLVHELHRRGIAAIDADKEPLLCGWISEETNHMVAAWSPLQQTAPAGCYWGWDQRRIHDITANPPGDPFFFAGNAKRMEIYYPLFDKVLALVADDTTIAKRLAQPRDNPHGYGTKPDHITRAIALNQHFAEQEKQRGAILVDASLPIAALADKVTTLAHED